MGLLTDEEGDSSWHGACLALAELAMRGLLLPARMQESAPLLTRALHYDVRYAHHLWVSHTVARDRIG